MSAASSKQILGRIAERIVSNELEYHGFRVSDLNKGGVSANADLLAAKGGRAWQIQVKGATWDRGHWVHYGFCNEAILTGTRPVFNAVEGAFYRADIVALVSVKSPSEYSCVVLPVEVANRAAEINLDYAYRTPKRTGGVRKPSGIMFVSLRFVPKVKDEFVRAKMIEEQRILEPYIDNWDFDRSAPGILASDVLHNQRTGRSDIIPTS